MRAAIVAVVFACVVLLVSAWRVSAQTATWDSAFPEAALQAHVNTGTRVIVISAGDSVAEARIAATTLVVRLRALHAALVMNDQSVGDVAALDDAAIVARCAPLPIEQVMIVRVFPGAADAPPTAVAILYNKAGGVVTAFSGARGQEGTLAASAVPATSTGVSAETVEPAPAGRGVDQGAAAVVAQVTRNARGNHERAQAQYDELFLALGSSGPERGKYRVGLEWDEFYAAVGRDDLAKRYRNANGLRVGLLVSGSVMTIVGFGLMLYGLVSPGDGGCADADCFRRKEDYTLLYVGGVMLLSSPIPAVIGALIDPHPVEPAEARRLAEEHNRGLRVRLGLEPGAQAAVSPRVRMSWVPQASRHGAGLSLRLEVP